MAQAYKVKLNKNHTAEPDQITKDGYLADDDGQPFIYNQSAAKDKAEKFGGTSEKFGKNHTISKMKMIQFDQDHLNQSIVGMARERQAYEGTDGKFICYGCIFSDLLELGGLPADIVDELKVLNVFCVEADYVQFL
jgi:hypothetical protein